MDTVPTSEADAAADTLDYEAIPAASADAVVDPFWLQLRGNGLLPSLYMPPTMRGRHSSVVRVVATALIGIFMLATTLGLCLTYGPPT